MAPCADAAVIDHCSVLAEWILVGANVRLAARSPCDGRDVSISKEVNTLFERLIRPMPQVVHHCREPHSGRVSTLQAPLGRQAAVFGNTGLEQSLHLLAVVV